MPKKPNSLLAIAMLALSMLACSLLAPGSGNVLFQDDFSSSASGWDRVRTETGVTDYEDGSYRIHVLTENSDIWANPGLSFSDVEIKVEATKFSGPDDNDFGVICRYIDQDNFYFFIISSDGYYGIGKVSGGQQQLLGREEMPPSEVIKQGQTTNHMRAVCAGTTLSLYVNDQLLESQEDGDFSSGDVGLLAGTYTEAGTDILFDNFSVLEP